MVVHAMRTSPANDSAPPPPRQAYVSQARWNKPAPARPNAIPAQSFLAYNWIDKDPELDFVLWAIADSGKTLEWIERETEKDGHKVSRYTLMNWVYGDVRRPHNTTISMVMAVLGWNRPWQRA